MAMRENLLVAPPPFQHVRIFQQDKPLGRGSYGAVYRAKLDRLPCAAKVIHSIFQDSNTGPQDILERFERECRFLSDITHPNIVQYLGTCRDQSGYPILFMELMDESLTHFLENSPEPLPYHLEVDFSHDVALALDYLHSRKIVIIHRDLSSNNVLLIAGSRAKVTDLGMSKIKDTAVSSQQTKCPGTPVYMPPEALKDHPLHTPKLDCYSFGVLMIQIMTRQFPNPEPDKKPVSDPRYSTGVVYVTVPEHERRKQHIDLITPNHPLLKIALACLENQFSMRPSAQNLCDKLDALKEKFQYTQSVERGQDKVKTQASPSSDVAELQKKLAGRNKTIEELQQTLREKEEEIRMGRRKSQQIQEHQLQQLEENQILMAEFQENLIRKEEEIRDLEQALDKSQTSIEQPRSPWRESFEKPGPIRRDSRGQPRRDSLEQTTSPRRESFEKPGSTRRERLQDSSSALAITSLTWEERTTAPHALSGSIASDGTSVYFRYNKANICVYDAMINDWRTLPNCPNDHSSLVIVNTTLTAVGGQNQNGVTNDLLSLTEKSRKTSWSKQLPSMRTKRKWAAVACSGRLLVAAGGEGEGQILSTVEVMDTKSHHWYTAISLPQPFALASATICGDNLYILGHESDEGRSKTVFTCSITALEKLYRKRSLTKGARKPSGDGATWLRVANAPVYYSKCTTLCGQLVCAGGYYDGFSQSDYVYQYDPNEGSWKAIGHTPGTLPLVAPLSGNRLIAVSNQRVSIASVGM